MNNSKVIVNFVSPMEKYPVCLFCSANWMARNYNISQYNFAPLAFSLRIFFDRHSCFKKKKNVNM